MTRVSAGGDFLAELFAELRHFFAYGEAAFEVEEAHALFLSLSNR